MPPTGYVDVSVLDRLGVADMSFSSGDFKSDDKARHYSSVDLAALGEDPRVVKLAACLSLSSSMTYGQFRGTIYAAVRQYSWVSPPSAIALSEKCGGHLVTIGSKAENDFAYSLIANDDRFFNYSNGGGDSFKHGPLIGFVQTPGAREPRGGWHWVNNEKITFTRWSRYNPDNFNKNQNYAAFFTLRKGNANLRNVRADQWDDTSGGIGFIMELD
jgi:hypothetical protein